MLNKSFKQNSLIKYTSILLLNLILVLIMGVTNIFGDLSEQDKKTRVSKAVEAAKQERTTQDVSDKEVTDDQLKAAAQLQVDKTDDAQKTQDKVTEAAKNFVENYKNAREQIIKKAVEEAQTERTTQKLSISEISDDVLNTEAKKQAKHDDPNKRTQEEVTAAVKKFVSDTKDNKIKDAIKAAQQVILDDTDKIVTLLVAQLGKESFYNAYKEAATQQANNDKADEREKTKVNEAAIKVANKQLNDAKTARDKKVQTALKNAKIVSLQKNCEYEEEALKEVANKQAAKFNEAENKESEVEKVVLDLMLSKDKEKKEGWVAKAIKQAIQKAVNDKKPILTQQFKEAAEQASNLDGANEGKVIAAAEKAVDDQDKTQEDKTTKKTEKQPEPKTLTIQEYTLVEVNTVVKDDLGEQAAELTDETAKAAVQKQYSNLNMDEVTVKVDAANKQVTVSAVANSKVYAGTATVKYTVKAATSDKPWYKSVVLLVSVGIAFVVAAVGVVYYFNKNKKFKK